MTHDEPTQEMAEAYHQAEKQSRSQPWKDPTAYTDEEYWRDVKAGLRAALRVRPPMLADAGAEGRKALELAWKNTEHCADSVRARAIERALENQGFVLARRSKP